MTPELCFVIVPLVAEQTHRMVWDLPGFPESKMILQILASQQELLPDENNPRLETDLTENLLVEVLHVFDELMSLAEIALVLILALGHPAAVADHLLKSGCRLGGIAYDPAFAGMGFLGLGLESGIGVPSDEYMREILLADWAFEIAHEYPQTACAFETHIVVSTGAHSEEVHIIAAQPTLQLLHLLSLGWSSKPESVLIT